ncbi:hypothetical protein COU54_04500 [Candidatus Pacearchaeota archaeon CG10_big_fil_rev_8_21_14_0_10_31_24]|nr:MAG: hypothetical protein COU54_04500 [Candidatus Pacearchaeota archaeon CG10_big_fil_rev_8_21_14_0_10_31_24]
MIAKGKKFRYIFNQLIKGQKDLGLKYLLLIWCIFSGYFVNFIKSNKFYFNKKVYKYFYGSYNHTWVNERAIEIPLVNQEIVTHLKNKKSILEIGNVMNYYHPFKHEVIDKYEKGKGIINQDALDFKLQKKYDLIISISTMEHVGWDEKIKDETKIIRAVENLKKHLNKEGQIIMTVPLGYNPFLDKIIEKKQLTSEAYFFKRGLFGRWKQISWEKAKHTQYIEEISAKVLVLMVIKN